MYKNSTRNFHLQMRCPKSWYLVFTHDTPYIDITLVFIQLDFIYLFIYLLNLSPYKKKLHWRRRRIHTWQNKLCVTGERNRTFVPLENLTPYNIHNVLFVCLYSTIYTWYFCIHLYTYTHIWKRLIWQKEVQEWL
jgi:hypothetical protein